MPSEGPLALPRVLFLDLSIPGTPRSCLSGLLGLPGAPSSTSPQGIGSEVLYNTVFLLDHFPWGRSEGSPGMVSNLPVLYLGLLPMEPLLRNSMDGF